MNYQLEMDKILESLDSKKRLLLHACCAPCSSYVLEYLTNYFDITILYYNPNIYPKEEFDKRFEELTKLIKELPHSNSIELIEGRYDYNDFLNIAKGREHIPEGGERCFKCYELRMREAAEYAKNNNYDYFTTTLSISPYKNSNKLNEIGELLEKELGIKYLYADFKKKNGYKRSIELSKEYNLYRQDYCGCIYSKKND
ncbi:MAG: epoxyqueuosine reductase QueH [Bacilli bacterium]|nr:epoxyqueuosine reductase QueH [Bacilli bacterium]